MAVPGKKPKEKKRRLGKGLESLLSKAVDVRAPEPASTDTIPDQAEVVSKETPAEAASAGLVYLHVENIRPNARQPR